MGFAVAFLLLAMIAALVFSAVDSAVHCRAGHLPGPWWTRFSTLSIMAYVPKFLSGTKHKLDFWLLSYYGRESGVVRFAPDSVLVADPILASAALATAGGWPKDPTFYGGNGKGTRNLFTHIDDKAHKELRRKMSPAFSIKSLNSFEPIIIASVTQDFLDRLARMSVDGNHEDLAKLFSLFTGDVIGNVGFGDQWNLVRTGHSIVLENSEKMVKGNDVPKMFLGRTVTRMLGLVSRTIRDGEAATEFIKNYAMKVVTDRRSGVTPRRDDLLQRLVDAKDPETGEMLTDKDIAHNTRLLIAAGDETTANQLSLITYLLLTHPHILARLVAEIDSAVDGAIGKDAEIIPYSVLKDLPYLDAVLREAMRLLPTTWAVTKRIAPEAWQHPTKPELYIPKGTRVEILNAALSSDTSIWGIDAAEFVPERWIGLGSKTEADFKYCFLPFSRGPRNCIGMGLAIMEMKMLLANVFRRFAIELVDQRLAKRERELKTVLFLLHAPAKGEMEVRVSRRCSN